MTRKLGLNAYILLVFALGVGLLAYTLPTLAPESLPLVGLLALMCAGAQYLPVSLFASSSVSVALAFAWVGFLLGGPAAAILVNIPSIIVHAFHPKRRPLGKVVFNLGLTACAAGAGGLIYGRFGGELPIVSDQSAALPLALAVLVYYVIDCGGVAVVLRLSEGGSLAAIWRDTYLGLFPQYMAIGGVSLGMALAYRSIGVVGLLLFSLPLVMAWQSFKAYAIKSAEVRSRSLELSETEHLLDAVVRSRVQQTAMPSSQPITGDWDPSHMEVAMEYAAETARRLGLDTQAVSTTRMAALLHDLGQALLPESVLEKRGPLTESEKTLVCDHPRLGANLVREMATTSGLAEAILYHHERFDGRGYPSKISGSSVPVSAQIVGVVEAFQAMTSKRPYRSAYSAKEAMGRLWSSAGDQFNPAVVEAFVLAQQSVTEAREERRQATTARALFASAQQERSRPLGSRLIAISTQS